MKETIREILDVNDRSFKVPALEYVDLDEMLKHATKEQIVSKLNGYMHAHGSNGDARAIVVDVVNKMSGIPFKTEKKKVGDKETTVRTESDAIYVRRAFAENPKLSFDLVEKEVQRQAKGYTTKDAEGKEVIVAPIGVDLRKAEPSVKKPKVLAQKVKDEAVRFFKGELKLDRFIAAYGKLFNGEVFAKLPNVADTDDAQITHLGWAIDRYNKAKEAAAKAQIEAAKAKEFAA